MRRIVFPAVAQLFFCISMVLADPLHVTVVLSDDAGAYQEFSDALRVKLPANKFVLNIQQVDDKLRASDLFIAVGMKAASELASKDVSTLNVLVTRAGYDKLLHAMAPHGKAHSAVFLDQPLERQVALLLAAMPDTQYVGVLYAAPQPDLQVLRHLLSEKKIRLHDQAVDHTRSLNDALEGVLDESEVLFVLPDPEVYNTGTIRNILLTAYRKKVPLVGISQAYVKAGALCAVFTTPEQVAGQTAGLIERYAESGKLSAPQYPSDFEVSVNMQVAHSLEIHIKDADQLRDEIRRVP